MPRIARGLADGFVYHVINRGNGRQEIFHKDGDYQAFVNLMIEAKTRYSIKMLAYCLMPNHFHMVLIPLRAEDLSRCMQWLMTSHVRRYHTHYGTSGHVWQGRFKSFIIQNDSHLLTVLRYVEGNPVRAGLVDSAKDWLWSSHKETSGVKSCLLIDEIPVELPDDWGKYVDTPLIEKELERLRQGVNRQAPYGSPDWQIRISKEHGLGSTLRPRGRPVKRQGMINEKK
ncbi:MAG: transposase [Deltaproteobacteria bacterium]|nr:transposase [Deltaproteobacteria bacterium]